MGHFSVKQDSTASSAATPSRYFPSQPSTQAPPPAQAFTHASRVLHVVGGMHVESGVQQLALAHTSQWDGDDPALQAPPALSASSEEPSLLPPPGDPALGRSAGNAWGP
jgi:hypothetical protein